MIRVIKRQKYEDNILQVDSVNLCNMPPTLLIGGSLKLPQTPNKATEKCPVIMGRQVLEKFLQP